MQLPAGALLGRIKKLAAHAALPRQQRVTFALDLLAVLVDEGRALLQGGKHHAAAQMLQAAHDAHAGLADAGTELQAAGLADDVAGLGSSALALLTWAHLQCGGGADKALQCVEGLRRQGGAAAAAIAVPFLTHTALLQARRVQEAETELIKIVTHEDVTPEVCASAIKAALLAPGGADGARAALAAAMELSHSPSDCSLVVDLTEVVLGAHLGGAPDPSPAAEDFILELFENDSAVEGLMGDPAARQTVHTLLWNHGVTLMDGGARLDQAAKVHAAAAALLQGDAAALAEAHLARAMCHIAGGDGLGAAAALAAADAAVPGQLATAFLRLKAALASGDQASAVEALQALAAAEGADADVLRLACCEALEAGVPEAAAAALKHLLGRIADDAEFAAGLAPGYEATIFQNLVALIADAHAPKGPAAMATGEGEGEGGEGGMAQLTSRLADLAHWLDLAVVRMRAVGPDVFFLNEDGRCRQVEWLALTAWNGGTQAAAAAQTQASAVLMGCCAELYDAVPSPDAETLRKQLVAYVMSAAAVLEDHSRTPDYLPALKLAERRLRAARGVEAAMAALPSGPQTDPKTTVFARILGFDLAVRQGDAEAAAAAVADAQAMPHATAEHFVKMAEKCTGEGPYRCDRSAKAALAAALQRLTSQPAMDYAKVAAVSSLVAGFN